MADISDRLSQLCKSNPDLDMILKRFAEIDRIYQQSLKAMGLAREPNTEVVNTANMEIPFKSQSAKFITDKNE